MLQADSSGTRSLTQTNTHTHKQIHTRGNNQKMQRGGKIQQNWVREREKAVKSMMRRESTLKLKRESKRERERE